MSKQIILDANILIRAVLGNKVQVLLQRYANTVSFLTVDEAIEDAKTYIPSIMAKHDASDNSISAALEKLNQLENFLHVVPIENLGRHESSARQRLKNRDEEDWPYLALALLLNCPIWTEDSDFFGAGVATWTSDRIELFFIDSQSADG